MTTPNLFLEAGARPNKEPKSRPIFVDRFFTGFYPNRNPLRSPLPVFYAQGWRLGSTDALIDGLNVELTNRLTIARRPGTTPLTLGTIDTKALAFYSFHETSGGIFTIIDTAASIYSANNYNTAGDVVKIFTKNATAGQSTFVGVGNTLFFATGKDSKKWIPTPLTAPPLPTLTVTPGGSSSLSPATYFVKNTYITQYGETIPSIETSLVVIGTPAAPTLSSVAGGSLAAVTYFVRVTYVDAAGETLSSAEASLAVAANNLLVVTSPGAAGQATGYNVYVSTTTGTETKQNTTAIAIGTNWTEPTTGLVAGAALPLSFTANGLLVVNSPPLLSGAIYWSVYVSTTTGLETRQAANISLGVNWTEPNTGLIAGASPPTSNTANPITEWGIVAPSSPPSVKKNSLANLATQNLTSVLLNGSSGYISTSQSANFALPGYDAESANMTNRSFAILLRTTASQTQPLIVVDDTQTGNINNPGHGDSLFYLDSGGHVSYSLYNTDAGRWGTLATSQAFNDGQWHWAVCTLFNPGGNSGLVATIYVDGSQQAFTPRLQPGDRVANFSGFYRIGGGAQSGPPWSPFASSQTLQYFSGNISHAAIWQGPDFSGDTWATLTPGQVKTFWTDLITKGQSAFETDILNSQVTSFWTLTETSGTLAADSTHHNNGTYQTGVTLNQSTVLFAGSWTASTAYTLNTIIIDTNGFQQKVTTAGTSGATFPTFATALNATTTDNTVTWTNIGPLGLSPTSAQGYVYRYSYRNNVTGHVSTASPASTATGPATAVNFTLTLQGSSDPQVDKIEVYRTADGGATPLFVTDIQNPGANVSTTYVDAIQDADLNLLIPAALSHANDPPPNGFTIPILHLGRIWGAVGNAVVASGGPDTIPGNGYEAFPPANAFVFPSPPIRLVPIGTGLLVFTTTDLFIIAGGPSVLQFFSQMLVPGLGLSSYNALAQNGSEIYLFTSDNQLVALEPSSGISEVGFPIGDLSHLGVFNPTTAYVVYHVSGSNDKAVYISDGNGNWYRANPHQAPDVMITGGIVYSPKATIVGAGGAIASIETSPGVHKLLVSQAAANSRVLMRDETQTIWADNGAAYEAYATIGSIILAQPGEMAELSFITAEFIRTGTSPKVQVLLDEISGTFTDISNFVISDPPRLYGETGGPTSIFANRYYLRQSIGGIATPPPVYLRHLQVKFDFGNTDTVQNELLSFALYGGIWLE